MTRQELPSDIKSPISGDTLKLVDIIDHNNAALSVAQFLDDSTEWYDGDLALYHNEETKESVYIQYDS